jgi:hypothetical protein
MAQTKYYLPRRSAPTNLGRAFRHVYIEKRILREANGAVPAGSFVHSVLLYYSAHALYFPCYKSTILSCTPYFGLRKKIEITAKRPPLVKFAAVLSLVVNWTSTFFIFILTCEVLIMRRGFMLSGTDLLGVTFTSLFALLSVRLLLPGAPEFLRTVNMD